MPEATATPTVADPTKAQVVRELKHSSPLISCRFDLTDALLFVGGQDSKLVRWNLKDGKPTEFLGHDSWVRAIGFAKTRVGDVESQTLLTGGYDGRLMWWDSAAEKPEPQRKIDAHKGWLRALAVTPDQTHVVTCGNDNKVRLWKISDGALVREFTEHESHVHNVAVHPDGKQLASGDLKGNVIHWELETGKQVRQMKSSALHKYDAGFMADYGGFRALTFSADGKWLAGSGITNVSNAFAGVGNAAVSVFDWEAGKEATVHQAKAPINGDGWGVCLHPQQFIISLTGGGGGGAIYFYKPGEKNEFFTFKLPNTARDMAISADKLHLATAHYDGVVRIIRLTP